MPKQLSLWPLGGFVNSIPRLDVPLNCLTGDSTDWLVGRKRLRRRAGSAIHGDTLSGGSEVTGILGAKWSAKCRRLISAALGSLSDGFPTLLGLWTSEATKAATLAFRNTNDDSWQVVGDDYSATHYPLATVPHFRVMPMVYENEYGGLTFHRLTAEGYRRHFAGGSRGLMQRGGTIATPGYHASPMKWDGGFNDSPSSGSEVCTIAPLGLVPPMQMPLCAKGNDLGSTVLGPWRGADAFFYSVLFENEEGELSMFCIPRPANSAYTGFPGFGYIQVDADNADHYYDSMVYANIPDGPPGTRWKRLLRSPKVDVATTGAGAIVQPSADALCFIPFARIPQGVHTYTDTAGNDASLDADPRIAQLMDLVWPPCARNCGSFDGHYTLGDLKANPYALLVAPWDDGARNLTIDAAALYADPYYYVAVTQTQLVLRKVTGGVATDTTYDLADFTIRELVDRITSNAADTTVTHSCDYTLLNRTLECQDGTFSDVYVGDLVLGTGIPAGARVECFTAVDKSKLRISKKPLGIYFNETVTFAHSGADDAIAWAAQPVPGADAGEESGELLRTRVAVACSWANMGTTVTLYGADQSYIEHVTPGMHVYLDGAFDSDTIVTAVNETTHAVTISAEALRVNAGASESVVFAYDTGDGTTGGYGFVRMFGNCWPVPLPWRKAYLDEFKPERQAIIYSGASPGFAQNAINTWFASNRRSGQADLGPFIGSADLGPCEMEFYAHGRMLLANTRTGETHNDDDYTLSTVSWTRGARSPYAIVSGNGWAIFLSDEGLFACDASRGEVMLSLAIYDPEAPVGERGALEHAIGACVIASESDADTYKVSAQVHGSVLRVRYFKDANSTYFDREIRYDFSAGVGRGGLAELVQPDGSPYPWSTPLTLPVSCSAEVVDADGKHLYAARDTNAGTGDGRVDEVDTGTQDNGALVRPMGYTGVAWPEGLNKTQVLRSRVVARKAGTGLSIGLSRNPELEPADSEWDDLSIGTSAAREYVRDLQPFEPHARMGKEAVCMRIMDDGSGPCPEVILVVADVRDAESNVSEGGA